MDDKDLLIQQLKAEIARLKAEEVPVVRCKDCLYSYRVDSREPLYDCRHLCRLGCTQWLSSDDFCSYGERKDKGK